MPEKNLVESLKKIVDSKETLPLLNITRSDREVASILSKVIKPQNEPDYSDLSQRSGNIRESVSKIINSNTQISKDFDNIKSLFPEVALAAEIVISSALSPNDKPNTELIIGCKKQIFPESVQAALNNVIKDHLFGEYKLDEELPRIVEKAYFSAGAYVRAIIPESSLDKIINGEYSPSTEEYDLLIKRGRGYLRNEKLSRTFRTLALESRTVKTPYNPTILESDTGNVSPYFKHIELVDNVDFLKFPAILESQNASYASYLSSGLEDVGVAFEDINNIDLIRRRITGSGRRDYAFITSVPLESENSRKSIGRPLILELPPESVVVVHTPGNPEDHRGYLVAIDENGYPINTKDNKIHSNNTSASYKDLSSYVLDKAKNNMYGGYNKEKDPSFDDVSKVYGQLVIDEFLKRLKNGLLGKELDIGENQNLFRVMLSRQLANTLTRILFIPKELVSYYAFEYKENGIGKSILDELRVLASLRAVLLVTRIMSQSKNSMPQTTVKVNVAATDPDPHKTAEFIVNEVMKSRESNLPTNTLSIGDICNYVTRSNINFQFTGHPKLPETTIDFEDGALNHVVPDSELEETLKNAMLMAMKVFPELVNSANEVDFATTAKFQNNIFLKEIILKGKAIGRMSTKDAINLINNDYVFKQAIVKVLLDNYDIIMEFAGLHEDSLTGMVQIKSENDTSLIKKEDKTDTDTEDGEIIKYRNVRTMFKLFGNNLQLTLPVPETEGLKDQSTKFMDYNEAVTESIKLAFLGTENGGSQLAGELSEYLQPVAELLKGYLLRNWMAKENYLPELFDVIRQDENGKINPIIFETCQRHYSSILESVGDYVKKLSDAREKGAADIENSEGLTGGGYTSSDSGESDSDSDSASQDDFGGGMDDLGGDDFGDEPIENTDEDEPKDDDKKEGQVVNETTADNEE